MNLTQFAERWLEWSRTRPRPIIDLESIAETYPESWSVLQFKIRRFRMIGPFFLTPLILVAVARFMNKEEYISATLYSRIGLLLFGIQVLVMNSMFRLTKFRCPRCNQWFFHPTLRTATLDQPVSEMHCRNCHLKAIPLK
jgi:hypothetical protein